MGTTSSKVKDRWNKKTYDSIGIRVKKGNKERIKQYANIENKSINKFIIDCISEHIQKRINTDIIE